MNVTVPTFTMTPDTCSQHGPIGTSVSVAEHLRVVHGLSYEQWQMLTELAEAKVPRVSVSEAELATALEDVFQQRTIGRDRPWAFMSFQEQAAAIFAALVAAQEKGT